MSVVNTQQVDLPTVLIGVTGFAVATLMIGSAGRFAAYESPEDELASLGFKIRSLQHRVEDQRENLSEKRIHNAKLMKEYGLSVAPSEVEMRRKYPKLYSNERFTRSVEADLDRVEITLLNLKKRRKDLAVRLGLSAEEVEVSHPLPSMKKFVPPPGMGD